MWRVVHGASCLWGEMSVGRNVRGVKCPWGEMSVGRNVRGAKCPWGEMSWSELSWGELSWGELSWGELSWGEWSGNRRTNLSLGVRHTNLSISEFPVLGDDKKDVSVVGYATRSLSTTTKLLLSLLYEKLHRELHGAVHQIVPYRHLVSSVNSDLSSD
jgi:hypothetical protein